MVNLLGCPFCGGKPTLINGGPGNCYVRCTKCKSSSNDVSRDLATELWNTRALSSPNAPVEPAGLRSLRHLLAHMPDKDLHLRRFDAQQLLQFIDSILAVRLDEAATRKDEREKCAALVRNAICDGDWPPADGDVLIDRLQAAIRNGGKQP